MLRRRVHAHSLTAHAVRTHAHQPPWLYCRLAEHYHTCGELELSYCHLCVWSKSIKPTSDTYDDSTCKICPYRPHSKSKRSKAICKVAARLAMPCEIQMTEASSLPFHILCGMLNGRRVEDRNVGLSYHVFLPFHVLCGMPKMVGEQARNRACHPMCSIPDESSGGW